jgi:CHAD domain-containing protein
MPIELKQARNTFSRLERQLSKLRKNTSPDAVHKFRTASRRVETVLGEVICNPSSNDKKLLKRLGSLRHKAGKVRDLDVQVGALAALKISGGNGDKTKLVESLVAQRLKGEKKLARACDRKVEKDLRQRLARAATQLDRIKDSVPLTLAQNRLAQLAKDHGPLTEKKLHAYRIVGKRARYIAELDNRDPRARLLIGKLKPVQDVIGDWHDWLKMTQKAQDLLGGARDSALVAMLQNVTRAKYRQALDAVAGTRTLISKPVASEAEPQRKSAPGREFTPRVAA